MPTENEKEQHAPFDISRQGVVSVRPSVIVNIPAAQEQIEQLRLVKIVEQPGSVTDTPQPALPR